MTGDADKRGCPRPYTDCGGGLCTSLGGMCDACADAMPERVTCEVCDGDGIYGHYLGEGDGFDEHDCDACGGTGYTTGTSEPS